MIPKKIVSKLTSTNVSADSERTKERVRADYSAASVSDKREIEELAGVKQATVYRVYKTGAVSAKIVVALASVFEVSPFWYTGEAEEKEPYSEQALREFLKKLGYGNLLKGWKTKRNGQVGQTSADVPPSDDLPPTAEDEAKTRAIKELHLSEATTLLHALYLRSDVNKDAAQRLWEIKTLLLE